MSGLRAPRLICIDVAMGTSSVPFPLSRRAKRADFDSRRARSGGTPLEYRRRLLFLDLTRALMGY